MSNPESWYVVKRPEGSCDIISSNQVANGKPASDETEKAAEVRWGPFSSQSEAIARRVGLIRSGKCQPV